jgi:hypothetical protein
MPWEDQKVEEEAFGKLLCAMCNRPYEIEHFRYFCALVRLAEFRCAFQSSHFLLPTAFATVYSIGHFTVHLLSHAKKVRSADLFLECLIHMASNCHDLEDFHCLREG